MVSIRREIVRDSIDSNVDKFEIIFSFSLVLSGKAIIENIIE
jgi:hypothetical protein